MADQMIIEKNSVQETMMIPLFGRTLCSKWYPMYYKDAASEKLIRKVDYDFSALEKKMETLMGRFGILEVAMRQSGIAIELEAYLEKHPRASVINLGCGLDQTAENCDNGMCRIYNIDFPDVIAVRESLIPNRERVKNIPANLTDLSWMEEIPSEDGAFFLAAGVFYYLKREDVTQLVNGLAAHFPGGVLVFDTAGQRAVKLMIKSWVKKVGINDVGAYFYVNDLNRDIRSWLKGGKVNARGYMLGYHDLKDSSVSRVFRLLAKVGDGFMKMCIVKIAFG